MGNTHIKRDVVSMFIIIAGGVLFAGLAFISLARGNAYGFACMTTIGIVLGIAGVYAVFDRRRQVSVSKNGIWVRGLSKQEIPWSMISSAKLEWWPRSGDFITITLVNGQTHRFFAEGLEVSSKELLRIINEQIEQAD